METNVLVSVVMPSFNASQTIERSIRSVLNQSFEEFELLVVDDCSFDNTREIVQEVAESDPRVRLIPSIYNSGSPATPRNIGIEHAKGRYIAFLDSDDTWFRSKLEEQLRLMEGGGAAISCTGYAVDNASGDRIGALMPPKVTGYDELLSENTLGCSTVMIDRSKVSDIRFPVCGHEDYALWLALTRAGHKVFGLQQEMACYRVAPGSVSSNKLKVLGYFWNIYRNMEGFSVIRSGIYCLRYAWNVRSKYARYSGARE